MTKSTSIHFLLKKMKILLTLFLLMNFQKKKLNIIIIPGIIFGIEGDSFFRISGLGSREDIEKAIERLEKYYN